MSLLVTNNVGTERRQLRRTIAEALRRLMEKPDLDEEAKDLAALIVFSLRALARGVDRTASAWERRNYYLKADRFRLEWDWVEPAAEELEGVLLAEDWDRLPGALAALLPRFADVRIARLVRPPSLWMGCYQRLVEGNHR